MWLRSCSIGSVLFLVMISLFLSCNRRNSGTSTSETLEPQEPSFAGNVLILEDPLRETDTAIADAKGLLSEKKYAAAAAALDRAQVLSNRAEHYYLMLLGVRSHLAHAMYVLRETNTEPSRVQLEKARKLISDNLANNDANARELLENLLGQVFGLMKAMEQDPKAARADLKRVIGLTDQLVRRHP